MGVVMGGEVTWEKRVQGKRVHKFWWGDILLGKETGTTVALPKAKARDVTAPGDVARMSDGWKGRSHAALQCPGNQSKQTLSINAGHKGKDAGENLTSERLC